MKVACLQICSGDNVALNLDRVERLLRQAAAEGCRLAALPENFAFMHPDFERKRQVAEDSIEIMRFLAEAARSHSLAIIGGSLLLPGPGDRMRNACPIYDRSGNCLGVYDKIHLFDVDLPDGCYRESEQIAPGSEPLLVDLDGWRLGVSICYDLRFPELYRDYAARGCELLSVPSAFTVPTGQAHWEVLLRARAIENQAYVLAPAQIGTHPGGRQTYGHSLIVDPWGQILARAANTAEEAGELVIADLDRQRLNEIRRKLPALSHMRFNGS
jgi:deaminated glutathione amidase